MTPLDIKITAKHFKCFGEKSQGFNALYPVNLIIGKNNSGKSALIDLIRYIISPRDITALKNKKSGQRPEIYITKNLTVQEITPNFSNSTSGGPITGNHLDYGMQWLNKPIMVNVGYDGNYTYVTAEPPFDEKLVRNDQFRYIPNLANSIQHPLRNKDFRKLAADRDIVNEIDNDDLVLKEGGLGATNIIQHFINKNGRDRSLVERNLLNDLNKIFGPETKFERVLVSQNVDKSWEISLEEKNKGVIPLSDSGSGLKTVFLVLINLILTPVLAGQPLNHFVFAFEELENNLHPSIQRRLLSHIKEIAEAEGCYFFLTTHSNVIIDLFGNDESAQIIHVTNDGSTATVKQTLTHFEKSGILEDLDFRASDLLQSNGVIWVEGPSDRIYLNRWIELWTDGQLKENVHYQCLFYGGRLLSHLSASDQNASEGISMLKANRNCAVVIDSDKRTINSKINPTKQRIKREVMDIDGFCWITKGKEIENYIHTDTINQYLGIKSANPIGQYEQFDEYLDNIKLGEGKKFLRNKVHFSQIITDLTTKKMLEENIDLKRQISNLTTFIKKWNKLD